MKIRSFAATLTMAGALGAMAVLLGSGPAIAVGPDGGEVTPVSHVCSGGKGPAGSNIGAGGKCTVVAIADGDWAGSGFTVVATHVDKKTKRIVTDVNASCPRGTAPNSPAFKNCTAAGYGHPYPAGDTVTVTSTGGTVLFGAPTGGKTP
ncbi:MAG: hypothetical protein QOI47_573 [Actinomycetota bacterium]|nr:hypothetical protein [Actinomycetota bacterium]